MIAVSVAGSFASSLVALPAALPTVGGVDGTAPGLADLLEQWGAFLTGDGDF